MTFQAGTPLSALGQVEIVSTAGRTDPGLVKSLNNFTPVQPVAGTSQLQGAFTNSAAGIQRQAQNNQPTIQPTLQSRMGMRV
jgi:hypothetical protein